MPSVENPQIVTTIHVLHLNENPTMNTERKLDSAARDVSHVSLAVSKSIFGELTTVQEKIPSLSKDATLIEICSGGSAHYLSVLLVCL